MPTMPPNTALPLTPRVPVAVVPVVVTFPNAAPLTPRLPEVIAPVALMFPNDALPLNAALPLTTRPKVVTALVALMFVALKLPVESRLTIALVVLVLVGATFQAKPKVPLPVIGEPPTTKSLEGALRPTLVTVPLPPAVLQAHADPFQASV